ncbi:hypothetical protein Ahy_B04g069931 [Arachis hypogaea]|uniref:Uncharacterized protein n=1 Tax=Arachis hypogaea TaxID=3818 RepID=A0A444ZE05_ARAHY|nr:hypothetical protein Ahy_B04g069931 [Arachis hypogaea]
MIEDYKMFIPFLELKKLASHPYVRYLHLFAIRSIGGFGWLMLERKNFISLTHITRRVCDFQNEGIWRGHLSRKKDREIEPPYIDISGQKTQNKSFTLKIVFSLAVLYDCAVYIMKWLKIFQPQNIEKGKYEWDNWTQITTEVDHFRVEFTSRILFHDMNRDRDAAIRGSEVVRLSKPSAVLLSSYCQIDSYDIDSN